MLTTNGKNYIAHYFGMGECNVASGLSWSYLGTDGVNYNQTGGTAQIVSNLVMTQLVQNVTVNSVTYTYAMLKAANDNNDLNLTDAQWVAANDGSGDVAYCVSCINPACAFVVN